METADRHRKTDRKMVTADSMSTFKYSLEVHTSSSVAIIITGI